MSHDQRRIRFEAVVGEVYEPLQRYLRRRASPDDAEEVLDDVLLTVWRRLDDVPVDAALPWSYGVARRALANRRRSNNRYGNLLSRLASQPEPPRIDIAGQDEYPMLADAFAALGERDREVLRLWAWEGLEPREIAMVMNVTPNAVSLKLARAKRRLADELARQNPVRAGHKAHEYTGELGR